MAAQTITRPRITYNHGPAMERFIEHIVDGEVSDYLDVYYSGCDTVGGVEAARQMMTEMIKSMKVDLDTTLNEYKLYRTIDTSKLTPIVSAFLVGTNRFFSENFVDNIDQRPAHGLTGVTPDMFLDELLKHTQFCAKVCSRISNGFAKITTKSLN